MSSTVSHSIAFKSAHNTYAKYVKTHTNTQDTEAETEKDTDKTCLENGIVVMIKLRIFILLPNFVKLRLETLNVSLLGGEFPRNFFLGMRCECTSPLAAALENI